MGQNINDDEVKNFLQKNQPLAPPAPPYELADILAKLEGLKKPRRFTLPRMFAVAGVAAAVLVALLVGPMQSGVEVPEGADYLVEELPTLDVGESYLDLVAWNGE